MARVDLNGHITDNNSGRIYTRWGYDVAYPAKVQDAINSCLPGEDLDVYINSGGGSVFDGSEIYTILREESKKRAVNIHITGLAASAASYISMASHCDITPVGMMMLHDVSTSCHGNKHDMAKTAYMLERADETICNAYMAKTGMSEDQVMKLLDNTTWLTAKQAKELGLVDEIMFPEDRPQEYTNAFGGNSLPPIEKLIAMEQNMAAGQLNTSDTTEDPAIVSDTKQKAMLDLLRLSKIPNIF